jgi:hypothetical protein
MVTVLALAAGLPALAQNPSLPTKQPGLIQIYREKVKPGHGAQHARHEAGWPAAYEKANFPYGYLALTSLTGPPEAWFVASYDSYAAMGDSLKRETTDKVLEREIDRLAHKDSEYIESLRIIHARAREDLSVGEFPDLAQVRFMQTVMVRVRPGREGLFEEFAKVYGAARKRADATASFRVYQVTAGMPGPTFLVFGSVTNFAQFDQMLASDLAARKGATAEESTTMQKARTEAIIEVEVNQFRVDPTMSYVSKEVRAKDPDFWMSKDRK